MNHQANFLRKSLETVYWYWRQLNKPNNETAQSVKVSYIKTHHGPVTLKYQASQLRCSLRMVWYVTCEKLYSANLVAQFDWSLEIYDKKPCSCSETWTRITSIAAVFPCFLWRHIFLFNITQIGVCGIAPSMFSVSFRIRYFIEISW